MQNDLRTSIKLFENYDAWLSDRFLELGATFITTTIRDSLELNEGLVQIYDDKNLHVGLTGNEIIQISVGAMEEPITRIYGIKHTSASVDSKGDTIITFNLISLHNLRRLKFARTFYPDARDSITEMINVIYKDIPLLKPKINGIEIHVPKVPWLLEYKDYINFVKEHGISRGQDSFPFVWEDMRGISIYDHDTIINRTPVPFIAGEPSLVGEFVDRLEHPIAYDIEFLTKNNPFTRNAFGNCTYYAHSFLDKEATRIIAGDGHNSYMISRSGGYAYQQYRNGYEEYIRVHTMSKYDSYIKFITPGDFNLTPGLKVQIFDPKNQFLQDMFIDTVVHEMSNSQAFTHVYCFSTSYQSMNINDTKTIKNLEDVDAVEIIEGGSDIGYKDETGKIDYQTQLSDNFTLADVSTNTAVSKYRIKAQNNLNEDQIIMNLKNLAEQVLEPIKSQYPGMIITSGFRTGVGSSQHLRGEAIDMQFTGYNNKDYLSIAEWIRSNIPHDQLLLEYQSTGSKRPWIHVSLKRTSNRKQSLTFFDHHYRYDGLVQMAVT